MGSEYMYLSHFKVYSERKSLAKTRCMVPVPEVIDIFQSVYKLTAQKLTLCSNSTMMLITIYHTFILQKDGVGF